LRETLDVLFTPGVNEGITDEELPPLTGGVVGYLGYDIVRRLEKLPNETEDVLGLPELAMLVATDLAVLDHKDGTVTLIANAINYDNSDERVDEAWLDAEKRLNKMQAALGSQVHQVLIELPKQSSRAKLPELNIKNLSESHRTGSVLAMRFKLC
jgi:anthranilate synthase component 1